MSGARPLVSVVIPAFNSARYITESIGSVKAQTVPGEIEIIVVDDGSTDNTADIAEKLGAKVLSIPNSGQVVAKNRGAAAALGDILMFHDSDDVLTPESIAKLYSALKGNPDTGLATAKRKDFISPDYIPESAPTLTEGFGALAGCALIKKEAFITAGAFDKSLRGGEDMALQTKLSSLNIPSVRTDFIAVNRRIHGDNLSTKRKAEVFKDYAAIIRNSLKRPS
ncbi:MAG: glycosyltransferase family 2 protein [Alphaproteobacteria bacterium]|nr:glycosyltransferase family 2 protein [Alphaproteobacteria bacterium]